MAAASQRGQRVVCVTATRGEAGGQEASERLAETLAQVRSAELAAALQILGVTEHHWLEYEDGLCQEVDDDVAAARLASIIKEVQPDTIITFGKEGMTGHPDHQAVCRWTHKAIDKTGSAARVFHPIIAQEQYEGYLQAADAKLNIFFAINQPPVKPICDCAIQLNLPPTLLDAKMRALAAMSSQTASMHAVLGDDMPKAWSIETLVDCSG